MRYEYFIALKHLTKRRKTGFISLISLISVLGVAVGVMALIVVLAVMSGFDRELKTKIVGANPHIIIEKANGLEESETVIEKIKQLKNPHLKYVSSFVQGQGILRSSHGAIGVVIKGLDVKAEDLSLFQKFIKEGSIDFETAMDKPAGVVIGRELARILAVGLGEEVDIISPFVEKKGLFKKQAKTMTFRVTGIFQLGMNEFDTSLALVGLTQAQELFHLGSKISGISIKLDDVDRAEELKLIIAATLGLPYWARSWFDLNRNFFSALKVEKTVMTILLLLIILVAAFNIISTLIMVVMEKTKDIGILRALGATTASVGKIFLLEGFTVGCLGVSLGAVLGLLMAFNLNPIADFVERTTGLEVFPSDIYYFDQIPTEVNFGDVSLIVVFALLASILAGLYPAYRAAQLNPVEALRYE